MRMARLPVWFLTVSIMGCGMEASSNESADDVVDTSEDALAAYRVEVRTTPSSVSAGTTPRLAIRVLGAGGQAVTQFDELHTQTMHVVGVSSDLQDFIHVHPAVGANGALSVDAPIARAQPYKFFFEYDPAGSAGEQTSRATIRPTGATAVAPALATAVNFDGSVTRSTLVGSTRVELQPLAHGMIMAGAASTLRVAVNTANGSPANDLVDWLGMPGHAIVLSENTSTFIHAHAMRPGSGGHGGGHGGATGHGGTGGTGANGTATAGNLLDIEVTLPRAGFYKMFVQVKRGSDVVTAPFVLRAVSM